MSDSIIKDRSSRVWKIISVVYALDISCEGTVFGCHREVGYTAQHRKIVGVGIAF